MLSKIRQSPRRTALVFREVLGHLTKDRKLRLPTATLSTLFALGVAEVLVRSSNYRPGTMDPMMYVANPNPLLPYRLQANYRGYCGGSEVTIDNDGNRRVSATYGSLFRSQHKKPISEVLILGDSGVFGFGLPRSLAKAHPATSLPAR